jgi:hypothetical protein
VIFGVMFGSWLGWSQGKFGLVMLLCLAYGKLYSLSVRGCQVFRGLIGGDVGKSRDFSKSSCRIQITKLE